MCVPPHKNMSDGTYERYLATMEAHVERLIATGMPVDDAKELARYRAVMEVFAGQQVDENLRLPEESP